MSDQPRMSEEIARTLTNVLNQARNYNYLFPTYAPSIKLVALIDQDQEEEFIGLADYGSGIRLSYNRRRRNPFEATPEKIGELVERNGLVSQSLLPKFLRDITSNFARKMTEAEFNYREQTPFDQQRKELEERLKAAVSRKP